MKRRNHKVEPDWADAVLGWSNAQLVVIEAREGVLHRTHIKIASPSMLRHIRQQLDKIEKNWREQIGC